MITALLQRFADWIVEEGRRFDTTERRPDAHREHLGEVYTKVIRAINQHFTVRCQEAFVRTVAWREFRRACGRDRKQAARHTPTGNDAVLESGLAVGFGRGPATRDLLDELIRQETCRTLTTVAEQLPPIPRRRPRSLTIDRPDG